MKYWYLLGFLFLFLPAIAYGQAVMTGAPITASEAKTLPQDSWVTVNGAIVNALPGGKNFTFRDASGEITVEIGSKIWRGLSVGVSDRVAVSGEVKINRGHVLIKAHAISGEGRTNTRQGQAITIREPVTVSEAKSLPHDSWAILNGNIVNALPGGKHYTFRDASGEIVVEIDQKTWRGLFVDVSDRVQIYGEVTINRGIVSIKIRAVRKI